MSTRSRKKSNGAPKEGTSTPVSRVRSLPTPGTTIEAIGLVFGAPGRKSFYDQELDALILDTQAAEDPGIIARLYGSDVRKQLLARAKKRNLEIEFAPAQGGWSSGVYVRLKPSKEDSGVSSYASLPPLKIDSIGQEVEH